MKNQFFADRRDFFKYDLLLEMMEKAGFIRQLSFIPLLTPNDNRIGGRLTRYECENRRRGLYEFLRNCLSNRQRDVVLLRTFFGNRNIRYSPFRDSAYFTHQTRCEYFHSIPDSSFREALLFLDPDNGLEVSSMNSANGDKYVRYDEAKELFGRMDASSLLVIYQHLPRQNRKLFFQRLERKLTRNLGVEDVICISDNTIAFVVLARDTRKQSQLLTLLNSYAYRLGLHIHK